jgi:alanine dehydrogenase
VSDIGLTAPAVAQVHADSGSARWIGEDDVVRLVSLPEVIGAIRDAYLRAAAGEVVAMPKTYASWDGGTMHAIGAVSSSTGLAVSKTWAHTGGGATPLLAAWEASTGRLLAVIQAFALGQLRTSAICGTATSALAAARCEVLAVIGSGKQAEGQIAAVAAVRDIENIAIYSPTAEHRTAFAARIADRSGIATRAADSVAEAVDQADVARARRVVTDDVAAARTLSPRELSAANAPHVLGLGRALAADDRLDGDGVTIFKALGSGISDLAVAELVIERASAADVGRPLSVSPRSQPKMWSA